MSADVLPPGGEGQIKVTLTPKGNAEDIVKRIVVISDDPEHPRFTLTMKGKLLVDVRADPATINFAELAPGEAGSATLSLTLTDPETVTLASVTLEDPTGFELRPVADPADAAPGEHRYELRFAGSRTVGSFATRVLVRTSGAHTPELTIPVRARVAGNLRYPDRLRFLERDGKIAARQIRITARDGQPPVVRKLDDQGGLLRLRPREPEPGVLVIDVEVDPEAWAALDPDERSGSRKLIVHTGDRDQPTLEIGYLVSTGRSPAASSRTRPAAPDR